MSTPEERYQEHLAAAKQLQIKYDEHRRQHLAMCNRGPVEWRSDMKQQMEQQLLHASGGHVDPNCPGKKHAKCNTRDCVVCFLTKCSSDFEHQDKNPNPTCADCLTKASAMLARDELGRLLDPAMRTPLPTCICGGLLLDISPCFKEMIRTVGKPEQSRQHKLLEPPVVIVID